MIRLITLTVVLIFAYAGTGTESCALRPVQNSDIILFEDGTAKTCSAACNQNFSGYDDCVGRSYWGVYRGGPEVGDEVPNIPLPANRYIVDAKTLSNSSCFHYDNGDVKCVSNTDGMMHYGDTLARGGSLAQLGDNLPNLYFGANMGTVTQLDCAQHMVACCVLNEVGKVKCWGWNRHNQLLFTAGRVGEDMSGVGDNLPFMSFGTGRTVLKILTVFETICAWLDNGKVRCVGGGNYGLLMSGSNAHVGNTSLDVDTVPYSDYGTGLLVEEIDGYYCKINVKLSDGSYKQYGNNDQNSLYNDSVNYRGSTATSVSDSLPRLDFGVSFTVETLMSTQWHTCAVDTAGLMKCYGSYTPWFGVLGDSLPHFNVGVSSPVVKLSGLLRTMCASYADGSVKCFFNSHAFCQEGSQFLMNHDYWTCPFANFGTTCSVAKAFGDPHIESIYGCSSEAPLDQQQVEFMSCEHSQLMVYYNENHSNRIYKVVVQSGALPLLTLEREHIKTKRMINVCGNILSVEHIPSGIKVRMVSLKNMKIGGLIADRSCRE